MLGNIKPDMGAAASVESNQGESVGVGFKNTYKFECFDKNGALKWEETVCNTVVNTGLDDILDKYYKGAAYTAAHSVGLISATPTIAATNTMASHVGWTEVVDYSETARPTLVVGVVAGQAADNSTSKATFTIAGAGPFTIGGAFVSTDATKSGTVGILVGAAAFSAGDKSGMTAGDTLNVTVTLTAATL